MLVGLQYHPGQTPLITKEWTSDAVAAGVLGRPVLSRDGKTFYVNGRDRRLWALNSADGKAKWSVPLDFQPQTPPSVAPSGLIVAGGGPDTRLVATQGRRRPCRGGVAPRRHLAADHLEPGRRRGGLHRGRHAVRGTGAVGVRPDRRRARSTAIRCRWPTATRSGCRWATTAAWWWPPAQARSTASPRPDAGAHSCSGGSDVRGTDAEVAPASEGSRLALAEVEDDRVVGDREVLVVRRVHSVAGGDDAGESGLALEFALHDREDRLQRFGARGEQRVERHRLALAQVVGERPCTTWSGALPRRPGRS